MKIFCYCSPYKYYLDNLTPLFLPAKQMGHDINISFSEEYTDDLLKCNEVPIGSKDILLNNFFKGIYKPDVVILAQAWWYVDKKIAEFCRKNKISFYIVDHAAPMARFVEKNGKKSHLYRSSTCGAKAFFAYGKETSKIMKKVGCREKIVVSGSPRIDMQLQLSDRMFGDDKITIYDTSHRMECEKSVKRAVKLAQKISKIYNLDIFIKQHPRSPGMVSELIGNDKVIKSEIEAAASSAFCIFTFPSSSMLLPAILNKKIIAAYDSHYSVDIRRYYKKYMNEIFNYNNDSKIKYNKFIKDNLERPSKGSAEFIIKWIEKNENSI